MTCTVTVSRFQTCTYPLTSIVKLSLGLTSFSVTTACLQATVQKSQPRQLHQIRTGAEHCDIRVVSWTHVRFLLGRQHRLGILLARSGLNPCVTGQGPRRSPRRRPVELVHAVMPCAGHLSVRGKEKWQVESKKMAIGGEVRLLCGGYTRAGPPPILGCNALVFEPCGFPSRLFKGESS